MLESFQEIKKKIIGGCFLAGGQNHCQKDIVFKRYYALKVASREAQDLQWLLVRYSDPLFQCAKKKISKL